MAASVLAARTAEPSSPLSVSSVALQIGRTISSDSWLGSHSIGDCWPGKDRIGLLGPATRSVDAASLRRCMRLIEIYEYLLVAPKALSPAPEPMIYIHLDPMLAVEFQREVLKPSDLRNDGSFEHKRPWRLHPSILSTSRAVLEEATIVLYGKNTFQFVMPCHTHDQVNWDCHIPEQCEKVFQYNDDNWRRSDGPFLLKDSGFACFLNAVGTRNAASLKTIQLTARGCDVGRYQSLLIANLLQRHVPELRRISILINNDPMMRIEPTDFDDDGANYRTVLSPLHCTNKEEELKQLCRTLTNLVRGCPSLEHFEYRGFSFQAVSDLETKPEYLGDLFQLLKERKEKKASNLGTCQEKEKADEIEG